MNTNIASNYRAPTTALYEDLQTAFTFFNGRLFDSRLPEVVITLNRKRNARGYFHAEQFVHRTDSDCLHEIALTPDTMGRSIPEVLSTLVHEMVHLWQQEYGKPGKGGNHNKEWGVKMDEVGLEPTSTGAPGGKRTGRKVTHMITPGGAFEVALADLKVDLEYFAKPPMPGKAKKKDLSKLVSCCPECNARAWSKQGFFLICGDCNIQMEQEVVETDTEGEEN